MNRLMLVLVAFVLLILFSGCIAMDTQGSPIHDKPHNEEVTLRFMNSWGGADSNAKALQRIFDLFSKKYPNIIIKNEAMSGADFLTKLKIDFASGNDPDVFGIWPCSDMKILIDNNKAADLTDILENDPEWKSSFGKEAWSYSTFNDRIYGLPVEIIYEALFINTDIFKQYDVSPPKTFEDLCILVRLFSRKNIIPIAYNHQSEGTYIYQNIVAQLGGNEGTRNNKKYYMDAMEKMDLLYKIRAFPEDAYTLNNIQRNQLFLDGKAAMIVQGSWFTRDVYEAGMSDSVEIIPFPTFKESNHDGYCLTYGLGCGTFFMSQKAYENENTKDASILLLKELTSKHASKILCDGSGFISNIDISDIKTTNSKMYHRGKELIANASELVPPPDSIIDRNQWENILVPSFIDVYEQGPEYIEVVWSQIDVGNK